MSEPSCASCATVATSPICANERPPSSRWPKARWRCKWLPAASCDRAGREPFIFGSSVTGTREKQVSRSGRGGDAGPLFPPEAAATFLAVEGAAGAKGAATTLQPDLRTALLHLVRRSPRSFALECTRWTLATLLETCPFLTLHSRSGLSRLFSRVRISYHRGREWTHSPDPDYLAKLARVANLAEQVRASAGKEVLLYLDEFTYYRHPTVARTYESRDVQALAKRSHRANTTTRIGGVLNLCTGQVTYRQKSRIGVAELVDFYQELRRTYPEAQRLYLVMDNWPVHFHPALLAALEPQENPFAMRCPPDWRGHAKNTARWQHLALPIQIVNLPTYASWTNPIEKLWRKLRQERLHMHSFSGDLPELRRLVTDFLDGYAKASPDLLRYVGIGG